MAAYFIFKEKNSAKQGVQILSMDLPSRQADPYDALHVPGRPEPMMHPQTGRSFLPITIKMEIGRNADIRSILAWLTGSGDLITSDDPAKRYTAYACDTVSVSRLNGVYRAITVRFQCSPFAYAIANDPVELTSSPAQIQTIGTMYSEPLIELTGTGDVTLTVNGVTLEIKDVSGTVFIDVHTCQVYKLEYGAKTSILSATTGWIEQMVLVPDTEAVNVISWTGDVSGVKITKNERWQ